LHSIIGIYRLDPVVRLSLLVLVAAGFVAGCTSSSRTSTRTGNDPSLNGAAPLAVEEGDASYYADKFEGRPTASGELFTQDELTAAHRTYPFGTMLRVVNLRNSRTVVVRVNDRGPGKASRVVDLSRRAAEELQMVAEGIARVRVEVLRWGG
jgi:rare lipoprotein A